MRANFKVLGVVGTIEERDSEGRWVVQAKEILRMIERGEDVKIENRVIKGDLNIEHIELGLESVKLHPDLIIYPEWDSCDVKCIKSVIEIRNCDIEGSVNFAKAIFHEIVDFTSTKFYGTIDFNQAVFCKDINFTWTTFNKNVNFYMTRFKCNAIFGYNFSQNNENGAKFHENVNFGHAIFRKQSDFFNTYFRKTANFFGAQFFENAYFNLARFEDEVEFISAEFKNDLLLNEAKLNTIRLFFIHSDLQISLSGSQFNRFYVRLAQIKRLDATAEDRLALINNLYVFSSYLKPSELT